MSVRKASRSVLAALGAALLLCACESEPPSVPNALVGLWRTETETHADRYLEFGRRTVVFGTGANRESVHALAELDARPADPESFPPEEGAGTVYALTYVSDGAHDELEVTFVDARPLPWLEVRNTPGRWTPARRKPEVRR